VVWEEVLAKLYSLLLIKPSARTLDLGTGFTTNLKLLLECTPRGHTIWSIDPSPDALRSAEQNFHEHISTGRVKLKQASAEELPFESNFFDYITSAITFHHVLDKLTAADELERVLASDGLGIILDWGRDGAKYSPHTPRQLQDAKEETLNAIGQRFNIRTQTETAVYYLAVFEKKMRK